MIGTYDRHRRSSGGVLRRFLPVIIGIIFLSVASVVLAAPHSHHVAITKNATVLFENQPVTNFQLNLENKLATIVFELPAVVMKEGDRLELLLELPFTMPAEWQPRLIPAKCVCVTNVERRDDLHFLLTATGINPVAHISLEAVFPQTAFEFSAGQKAALGFEQASPWLLALALLLLIGSMGVLGWMIRELINIRKFRLMPTPLDYPPNEISAAMVSLIPSGKITTATLAAMLISLAQRGYVTIIKTDGHFHFTENKPVDLTGPGFALGSLPGDTLPAAEIAKAEKEGLTVAEKFFLSKLFTQTDHDVDEDDLAIRLGHRLSSWKIGKVYAEIYQESAKNGYFIKNPHIIHLKYRGVGIAIFFAGIAGFVGSFFLPGNPLFLQLMWALVTLAGYIVTRMVPFLPLLTVMGQAEWARWGGFRLYLAEKEPLPANTPAAKFFDYLPYVVGFDELDAWVARFSDRELETPAWYQTEPRKKSIHEIRKELEHLIDFIPKRLATIHEHTVL